MPARQETSVSPSAQDILDANTSTTPLRPRRAGLKTKLTAAGLMAVSPFLEGCTPGTGARPDSTNKPDIVDQVESLAQQVSERVSTFKDYYLDPTGRNQYIVEVEYNQAMYQCTDAVQALSKIYGIPIDATRHASAKDYLNPNPTTHDWFNTFTYAPEQSLQVIPPEGSIVVFNEKIGDVDGHVGISLGTGEITQGNMEFDVISQNYDGQPIGIQRFNAVEDGYIGTLYPTRLGPEGAPPPRELAFTVDAPTLPPQPTEPVGPTPEATADLSESTVEQQASYAVAKNFLDYLDMGNYIRPNNPEISQDGEHVESTLILPDGLTKEELAKRLAMGETVTLNKPIEYYWLSYQDNDTNRVARRGQVFLNNLYLEYEHDNLPQGPEELNGLNLWGIRNIMAYSQWSGITGYRPLKNKDKFIEELKAMDMPELSPWDTFGIQVIFVATDSGTRLFPDLTTGGDNRCFGCQIGGNPLEYGYDSQINADLVDVARWYALDRNYLQSLNP